MSTSVHEQATGRVHNSTLDYHQSWVTLTVSRGLSSASSWCIFIIFIHHQLLQLDEHQHQYMNGLLVEFITLHWIIIHLELLWLVPVDYCVQVLGVSHQYYSSPTIVTWWLWLCQCKVMYIQVHPYIRINVNISAWTGYWLSS